jgi:DNA-binding MarR family transcriptional regulator
MVLMGTDGPRRKKAIATDVWRLVLECSMSQFGRASGILQRLGLTPGHMKLLMHLEEGDARAMGSLAQSSGCDASTMTWLVDRLEERGLVERRMLPSDRRVKAVALTRRGVEMKARMTERLYEPPAALLNLDREALEEVRAALAAVREADREVQEAEPHRAAAGGRV